MLKVATPGVTAWSRVELPGCSVQCATELEPMLGVAPALDVRRGSLLFAGWSRPESEAEGMARYALIARAIANVVAAPPAPWKHSWSRVELGRALVTIARHESAFWRPVHAGALRGPAGEVCLVQVHPITAAKLGIDLESLVGVDLAATERCLRVGAELLARARLMCGAGERGWFPRAIAAYGSGEGCTAAGSWRDGVDERLATFDRTDRRDPLPLLAWLALNVDEAPVPPALQPGEVLAELGL